MAVTRHHLPRPVVGVSGPDRGGLAAWFFTALAVWRAGGRPRRLTPLQTRFIPRLDALVLGGGADVDPRLYDDSAEPIVPESSQARRTPLRYLAGLIVFPLVYVLRHLLSAHNVRTDSARDELERRLLEYATRRALPVLGICRGAQVINVFYGGSLHRDLAGSYVDTPRIRTILPRKAVSVAPDSRLANVLGVLEESVNAMHRQAVDAVGRELVVAAREASGVVQAVEHPRMAFLLGVQWHPEFLPQQPRQQRLFRELVAAARGRRA